MSNVSFCTPIRFAEPNTFLKKTANFEEAYWDVGHRRVTIIDTRYQVEEGERLYLSVAVLAASCMTVVIPIFMFLLKVAVRTLLPSYRLLVAVPMPAPVQVVLQKPLILAKPEVVIIVPEAPKKVTVDDIQKMFAELELEADALTPAVVFGKATKIRALLFPFESEAKLAMKELEPRILARVHEEYKDGFGYAQYEWMVKHDPKINLMIQDAEAEAKKKGIYTDEAMKIFARLFMKLAERVTMIDVLQMVGSLEAESTSLEWESMKTSVEWIAVFADEVRKKECKNIDGYPELKERLGGLCETINLKKKTELSILADQFDSMTLEEVRNSYNKVREKLDASDLELPELDRLWKKFRAKEEGEKWSKVAKLTDKIDSLTLEEANARYEEVIKKLSESDLEREESQVLLKKIDAKRREQEAANLRKTVQTLETNLNELSCRMEELSSEEAEALLGTIQDEKANRPFQAETDGLFAKTEDLIRDIEAQIVLKKRSEAALVPIGIRCNRARARLATLDGRFDELTVAELDEEWGEISNQLGVCDSQGEEYDDYIEICDGLLRMQRRINNKRDAPIHRPELDPPATRCQRARQQLVILQQSFAESSTEELDRGWKEIQRQLGSIVEGGESYNEYVAICGNMWTIEQRIRKRQGRQETTTFEALKASVADFTANLNTEELRYERFVKLQKQFAWFTKNGGVDENGELRDSIELLRQKIYTRNTVLDIRAKMQRKMPRFLELVNRLRKGEKTGGDKYDAAYTDGNGDRPQNIAEMLNMISTDLGVSVIIHAGNMDRFPLRELGWKQFGGFVGWNFTTSPHASVPVYIASDYLPPPFKEGLRIFSTNEFSACVECFAQLLGDENE